MSRKILICGYILFLIKYYFIKTFFFLVCVAEHLTDNGNFTSPGYPSTNPWNEYCTWSISVKDGSRVKLSVDSKLYKDFCGTSDIMVRITTCQC